MGDVSNKSIVFLLAIALVITVAGTFVSVNQITDLQFLTGAAVDTAVGTTNLTIAATTSIIIANGAGAIDFGSGFVNNTCSVCKMDTLNGTITGCCVNFNNVSAGGFLLENAGNVNISVGVICTGSCSGDEFVGNASALSNITAWVVDAAADATTNSSGTSQIDSSGSRDTAASCTALEWNGWIARFDNQSNTSPGNFSVSFTDGSGAWLCGNATSYPLEPDNTKDAGIFHLNVTIDALETGTGRQANITFTFNATSSA